MWISAAALGIGVVFGIFVAFQIRPRIRDVFVVTGPNGSVVGTYVTAEGALACSSEQDGEAIMHSAKLNTQQVRVLAGLNVTSPKPTPKRRGSVRSR